MRAYSDNNPNAFLDCPVLDISPLFDNAQGERDVSFCGLAMRLNDGRTMVVLDLNEVKMIKAFTYLSEGT